MKTILFVPLDERPCNYEFPAMLAGGAGCRVITPPREMLGKKKQPGNAAAIREWLLSHAAECDIAVVSIDTLLYSGIVPSRLHHESPETLLAGLDTLRELKKRCPTLTLYAFNLIMRNPTYSSGEEEPDYYASWGREIFLHGSIGHRRELGIATDDELRELEDVDARLPREYLDDYLSRRAVNLRVNQEAVHLAAEGVLDFLIIPQDDSSPYGLTAKDQQVVRELIDRLRVNLKVYMYPDADAVANTLVARAVNRMEGRRPLVSVRYASSVGHAVVPTFEDRIVSESIKYQILAAGGLVASSDAEAQLILLVNVPGGEMQDHLQDPQDGRILQRTIQYDAFRTLAELVEYAGYAVEVMHKNVIFADIAYGNGGDLLLLSMLKQRGILWKVAGYAGWNTSSNTLGTCLPMGMIYDIFGETQAHCDFLALRYVEDIGYDAIVRQEVCGRETTGADLDAFPVDGPHGRVAEEIRNRLAEFASRELDDDGHTVQVEDCRLPWERLFEAELAVTVTRGSAGKAPA